MLVSTFSHTLQPYYNINYLEIPYDDVLSPTLVKFIHFLEICWVYFFSQWFCTAVYHYCLIWKAQRTKIRIPSAQRAYLRSQVEKLWYVIWTKSFLNKLLQWWKHHLGQKKQKKPFQLNIDPVEGSNSYDQLRALVMGSSMAQYQTRSLIFYSITYELWSNLITIGISCEALFNMIWLILIYRIRLPRLDL